MIFIIANLLKPEDRLIIENETHKTVVDFLKERYPDGFQTPHTIYINNIELLLEDYDKPLKDKDLVLVMARPGVSVALLGGAAATGWALAGYTIAALAANLAISFVVGKIFSPDVPDQQATNGSSNSAGHASSTYSLNSNQNEAKRGSVIPIIYGKVRTYPALINEPYFRYENNNEYLYQTMCIGQGKYVVNELLISDTPSAHIKPDILQYRKLEIAQFGSVDGIKNTVGDDQYWELTKRIDDVQNLELRGTPSTNAMTVKFEGSTITFYDDANGNPVDLSSLGFDSGITITESISNNGSYLVDTVAGNVVTVQSHTFTLEPVNTVFSLPTRDNGHDYARTSDQLDNDFYEATWTDPSGTPLWWSAIKPESIITLDLPGQGVFASKYISNLLNEEGSTSSWWMYRFNVLGVVFDYANYYPGAGATLQILASGCKATFETSYGPFLIKELVSSPVEFTELDTAYLGGVYGVDSSGNFVDHTVEYQIVLTYKDDTLGDGDQTTVLSQTGKENDAIRRSDRHAIPATWYNVYLTMKRITPEPLDTKTYDKVHIRAVKVLYTPKDNVDYGNITLLWAKVKASNAINNIGQFSINAWVTRTDVLSDIGSVLTDLYTNTAYGGRLPEGDLDFGDPASFPTTYPVVNGAIDSKMTLYDVMQMVAKSVRYSVYPVGGDITLKHDDVQAVQTSLFNETNIVKDSFKISYLFAEEDEVDSVKVYYRDPIRFTQQSVIYPTDGAYPQETELWGCTDEAWALSMATYLFKQDRTRRKSIEFRTDVQGMIPQFLDRVGISHNLPNWGFGGMIAAVSGRVITLECNYDVIFPARPAGEWPCDETSYCGDTYFPTCPDGSSVPYDSILFRNQYGAVSDIYYYDVTGRAEITLREDAPTWLYVGPDYDNTPFSIGIGNEVVKDYIVTSVKPGQKESVSITAVNYDPSIYS